MNFVPLLLLLALSAFANEVETCKRLARISIFINATDSVHGCCTNSNLQRAFQLSQDCDKLSNETLTLNKLLTTGCNEKKYPQSLCVKNLSLNASNVTLEQTLAQNYLTPRSSRSDFDQLNNRSRQVASMRVGEMDFNHFMQSRVVPKSLEATQMMLTQGKYLLDWIKSSNQDEEEISRISDVCFSSTTQVLEIVHRDKTATGKLVAMKYAKNYKSRKKFEKTYCTYLPLACRKLIR